MRKVAYALGELFWVEAVGCQEGAFISLLLQTMLIPRAEILPPLVFCSVISVLFWFVMFAESGETRRLCLNGKDVMQEFCDPKEWQQLAQDRDCCFLIDWSRCKSSASCNTCIFRVFQSE